MFHTVAPWCPSGYGRQIFQILPMVTGYGAETACVCYQGLQHGILEQDGVRFYPSIVNEMGEDAVMMHAWDFQPDVVISFTDIWALDLAAVKEFRDLGINWVPLVPLDYEPTPQMILERLQHANEVITMSPFGQREMVREEITATHIPHTVDTSLFKPCDKAAAREEFELPADAFVFGMVAANATYPPRKSFQTVLDCFAQFHRSHPDAVLYLHTMYHRKGGFPISDYIQQLGIENAVFTADDYTKLYLMDDARMARLYSSFDCLLSPSTNEGFGVPIIEAMACETPVIANDFTSMRDLVEDGVTGYKTRVGHKRYTRLKSYVGEPCPQSLFAHMEQIYGDDRDAMGTRCREFVRAGYDTEMVRERDWIPFLDHLSKTYV